MWIMPQIHIPNKYVPDICTKMLNLTMYVLIILKWLPFIYCTCMQYVA